MTTSFFPISIRNNLTIRIDGSLGCFKQIAQLFFTCFKPPPAVCVLIIYGKYTINPRANGAKRRSGRKPGARVTNRAIAKSKVGSSRKGGHYVIFSIVVVEQKTLQKNIAKD